MEEIFMNNNLKKAFETAVVMLFLWPFFGIALLIMGLFAAYSLALAKSHEAYEKTVKSQSGLLHRYFMPKIWL